MSLGGSDRRERLGETEEEKEEQETTQDQTQALELRWSYTIERLVVFTASKY